MFNSWTFSFSYIICTHMLHLIKYMTSPIFEPQKRLKGSEWLLHVSPRGILVTCKVNRKVLIMSIYKTRGAHPGYKQQWGQYSCSISALCYYFMSPLWAWRVQERRQILKDLIKQSQMRVPRSQVQDETQIRGCWQWPAGQLGIAVKASLYPSNNDCSFFSVVPSLTFFIAWG